MTDLDMLVHRLMHMLRGYQSYINEPSCSKQSTCSTHFEYMEELELRDSENYLGLFRDVIGIINLVYSYINPGYNIRWIESYDLVEIHEEETSERGSLRVTWKEDEDGNMLET